MSLRFDFPGKPIFIQLSLVVANAMFHKILDNVGIVAKDYNLGRICLLRGLS